MNITITVKQRDADGSMHEFTIIGVVDSASNATNEHIAGTLFQMEYAINEHFPKLRCHISATTNEGD